ncbi:hypothetical protein IPM19_00095 [bacterium]|nr:MAG: hypothetical protein IPM19_00095 [bacterium]
MPNYNPQDQEADFSKFFEKNKANLPKNDGSAQAKQNKKLKRKYYIYGTIIVILVIIQIAVYMLTRPPEPAKPTAPATTQN